MLRFAGTSAPGYVREVLHEGRAAGAILFRDNLTGPEQARALTRQLRRGAAGTPLISVDQEGGEVRNLPVGGAGALRPAAGRGGDGAGRSLAAGRDLRAAGINVSLAPVADVASVPGRRWRVARSRPTTRRRPRRWPTPCAAGAPAASPPRSKHFPGLGGATVNTDDGPATVSRSAAELREQDLEPFRAAIAAGVPLVMAGHATYPAHRPRPHRVAVRGGDRRPAARRAGLPRRRDHRLDGGRRRAGGQRRRGGGGAQRARGRRHRAHDGARAPTSASTGRCWRRRDEIPAFRARVRESAARVMALQEELGRAS